MAKSKFLESLAITALDLLLPAFVANGGQWLADHLENFYADDPNLATSSINGIYPFIDVYLEDAVKKSKTKIDDKIIAELKSVAENFAESKGITLLNLDAGTPND